VKRTFEGRAAGGPVTKSKAASKVLVGIFYSDMVPRESSKTQNKIKNIII
jgi:hypothetical protein